MNESLLKSSPKNECYDPFASPPDLEKAADHRLATQVGTQIKGREQLCPCCANAIYKQQIPLLCQDQQLLFLGIGYPFLYKLMRYFAIIITFIFILSGSAFYLLIILKCHNNCLKFLGFPIINMDLPPYQAMRVTQISNMITAIGIFVAVVYIKSILQDGQSKLQMQIQCPSQYTIMIQHLPQDVKFEELKQWIKKNFKATPIKINLAYDVDQLRESLDKRNSLTIDLNKLTIELNDLSQGDSMQKQLKTQIQQVKAEINRQDRILQHYKQWNVQCKLVGTAFVTFQSAKTVEKILQQYQCTFLRSILARVLQLVTKPHLRYENNIVLIFRAPAPNEIIWQNLGFSYIRSIIAQIIFIIVVIFLIMIAFKIQFYFVLRASQLRKKGESSGNYLIVAQSLVISGMVVLLNSLLRLVIYFFTTIKKYYSHSKLQSSFCAYYSLAYILISCFMIYIVHGGEEHSDGVLLYDIHIIMLANAFSQPLFKIFDPFMWARIIWRYYIMNLKRDHNPYTQSYINKLWEGYTISNADNYAYATRILFITTWFAHIAPLGVIFSLVGLLMDYWVGKFLLLRVYRKPETISIEIAEPILLSLQLLPLVYICGVLQFTYKVAKTTNIFEFLYEFLSYGITTAILILCVCGYFIFFKTKPKPIPTKTYQQIQFQLGPDYEQENPMTKLQGKMNYLNNLYEYIRKSNNTKTQQQLINLLQISRASSDQLLNKNIQIQKLKKRAASKLRNKRSEGTQLMELQKKSVMRQIVAQQFQSNLSRSSPTG